MSGVCCVTNRVRESNLNSEVSYVLGWGYRSAQADPHVLNDDVPSLLRRLQQHNNQIFILPCLVRSGSPGLSFAKGHAAAFGAIFGRPPFFFSSILAGLQQHNNEIFLILCLVQSGSPGLPFAKGHAAAFGAIFQ